MKQAIKTRTGNCTICSRPIYEYHINLDPPFPADVDCGGDCWACVASAEDCYKLYETTGDERLRTVL